MLKQDLTHDDAIKMVEIIGEALKWERHVDAMGISYYGKNEKVVVRISDHSTHLETWVKYNTNEIPNKYSIVIEVNPSKPITEINSNVPQFMVYEYKHKLNQIINDNNDVVINMGNAINGIMSGDFQFSNPYNVNRKILVSKYLDKENKDKKIIKCNYMKTSKNVIRINESQLKQMISESVKKVLNEISIDALERAQSKAFDEYDSMWSDDEDYDETIFSKRKRQSDAFKNRIHQLKSEGGKEVYYVVIPGFSGFYDGQVKKVYMTPEEAKQYSKQHDGNIYTDYIQACKAADYLD